jgi:hypothetical protein
VEKEMLLKREEAKKTGECRVKHEHGDNKLNRPCGGDGSKKCRTARQLLMRWGVYGIGEHSAEFWASPGQRGSADYGLGRKLGQGTRIFLIQHQREQTHIPAAIIKLLEVKLNVLYSVS